MQPPPSSSDSCTWPLELTAGDEAAGQRLDAFLAAELPQFSRAAIQRAIAAGHVTVDGQPARASLRLAAASTIVVAGIETPRPGPQPANIPLDVLYEDQWMVVVNKPPGMVVHPAKGHWEGTLASALAFHFGQLSSTGGPTRPGIVHRLDRDTSGVMVVARHDQAHQALAAQFKDRSTQKEYTAIVRGATDRDADVVDQPIGPHPKIREAKAIRPGHPDARPALTRLEVAERFPRFSLLRVLPKTGRTHQIRVHLASIGLPILCDRLYGGSAEVTGAELGDPETPDVVLRRQALHAMRLAIRHPESGQPMTFEAPLPVDLQAALDCLRRGETAAR